MNKRKAWFFTKVLFAMVLPGVLLLAACGSQPKVGALRNESQSVELGDASSVSVEIKMGAGDLQVTGGADKLLEADFKYNVAVLKPEVGYTDGRLEVRQPETSGMPNLLGIMNFRNEWDLRLNDQVPMDLSVDLGGGTSHLQLAGLALTGLKVSLGAGDFTLDLGGDWARDLDATIDTGAANTTLRLPSNVGVRVRVEPGPNIINATGLTKDGNFYTNAAYGVSKVTWQIDLVPGIGLITLEVEQAAAMH
jgi:hypothetical protein